MLDRRQLLWFKKIHPVWGGYFSDRTCIGWFKGYDVTRERDWQLLLGVEKNGVWWLEVQGERTEYGGLPELIEALEKIRDTLRLALDPFYT